MVCLNDFMFRGVLGCTEAAGKDLSFPVMCSEVQGGRCRPGIMMCNITLQRGYPSACVISYDSSCDRAASQTGCASSTLGDIAFPHARWVCFQALPSGEDDEEDSDSDSDDDDIRVTIGNIKTGAPSYMYVRVEGCVTLCDALMRNLIYLVSCWPFLFWRMGTSNKFFITDGTSLIQNYNPKLSLTLKGSLLVHVPF